MNFAITTHQIPLELTDIDNNEEQQSTLSSPVDYTMPTNMTGYESNTGADAKRGAPTDPPAVISEQTTLAKQIFRECVTICVWVKSMESFQKLHKADSVHCFLFTSIMDYLLHRAGTAR